MFTILGDVAGKVGTVAVYKLDRLSRSQRDETSSRKSTLCRSEGLEKGAGPGHNLIWPSRRLYHKVTYPVIGVIMVCNSKRIAWSVMSALIIIIAAGAAQGQEKAEGVLRVREIRALKGGYV